MNLYNLIEPVNKHNPDDPGYLFVRPAWALSIGWKSRTGAGERLPLAEGKGVNREVKSEGSRKQTFDLRYTNPI